MAEPGVTGRHAAVVSLVPSITETLLEWGVRPIGVTRFCDAPGTTAMGGTKNPDIAAIVDARPDVVLMDEEENRRADADELRRAGIEVVATRVRSLEDVAPACERLAAAVGARPPAVDPATAAPARWGAGRRAVWVPIWRRPWMTIGGATYGSSLLAALGLDNVFSSHPDPYPTTDLEEVATLEPEVVLAPSEPYPFSERHRAELAQLAPVVLVDGRDLFWWGSRTPGALRRLGAVAAELRNGPISGTRDTPQEDT